MSKCKLHFFGPADISGFTTSAYSSFRDLNTNAIVRELVQNSLDAVKERNETPGVIRFEIEDVNYNKIPSIEEHKKRFDLTVKDQRRMQKSKKLPDQAEQVVNTIENSHKTKENKMLFVLDNGVGLDAERMKGLLADGLSVKSESSLGAVGNGHLTIIPTSDLRYVLYGGVTRAEGKICSGHTILASHEYEGVRQSKDGYYLRGLSPSLDDPYEFITDKDIPDIIKAKLDWIEDNWSCGSAIIVPAFNGFRKDNEENLLDLIFAATATNFFSAIHDETLRAEYIEDGQISTLEKSNLEAFLQKAIENNFTDKKFISATRAWEAYKTLISGIEHTIETEIGGVTIKIRHGKEINNTHLELLRDGMSVTDDIIRLRKTNFSSHIPFHCVLLLESGGSTIYNLIRKAEGALHNSLDTKFLHADELQKLQRAFKKVSDEIKKIIPIIEEDSFELDILNIDISSSKKKTTPTGKFREAKPIARVVRESNEGEEGGTGPSDTDGKKKRNTGNDSRDTPGGIKSDGKPVAFRAACRPTGEKAYSGNIISYSKIKEGEIRFYLDENIDVTCEQEGESPIFLRNIKLDDKIVNEELLIKNDNNIVGIKVFDIVSGQDFNIEFEYNFPNDIFNIHERFIPIKLQLIEITKKASDE